MLAKKPPMGWNSWNTFTNKIDEKLIMETADAMVDNGLLDAGYEYLVIDDCWSEKQRDENGMLVADKEKFPHGIKYVADYVHSKGLKFGMYSCCGTLTCAGYPGSFGHEFDDAKYFAEVGVDFLKYDNCYKTKMENYLAYMRMSVALRSCGREILFSACNWGTDNVHSWARAVGAHMYRSTFDITDTFESIKELSESQKDKLVYSAPGCYNDIDMLVTGLHGEGSIGFGHGCTEANYRYHFAFWCLASSPLMIGCDVRNLSKENKALLTNPLLIRINQDEEGRPPIFFGDYEYHAFKVLSNNEYAIGFFNPLDKERKITFNFHDLGLMPNDRCVLKITDAFTGEDLGVYRDYFSAHVGSGDAKMFIATPVLL
ncbi:MAG: glycoside hydrolase family 27 protein [Clostridia bacterium]|nr:glycoside hydrolase family 27 protein [Clostridia bacterium]